MAARVILELCPNGVSTYIRTTTLRVILTTEFQDVLYLVLDGGRSLYSLAAPTDFGTYYKFTGIIRRLIGMRLSETSLIASEGFEITASAILLISKYLGLIIEDLLSRTTLQTKDITFCGIVFPDSLPVPLIQIFLQGIPAFLSFSPIFIPNSHVLTLYHTLNLAEKVGLPTGLHFQSAIQVTDNDISFIGAGIRFLSSIAAAGGLQHTIFSQLATSFHSLKKFVRNITDRMRMLCYQNLQALIVEKGVLVQEAHDLKTQGSIVLTSLYTSLLEGFTLATQTKYVDIQLTLPKINTENMGPVTLFSAADLAEVLILSAQESYNCVLSEGIVQIAEANPENCPSYLDDLRLASLNVSTNTHFLQSALLSLDCYSITILKEFFLKVVHALNLATTEIINSIIHPLMDSFLALNKENVNYLTPCITIWQDISGFDPFIDILRSILIRNHGFLVDSIDVHILQDPRIDLITAFLDNATVCSNSIFSHYTINAEISYVLGRKAVSLIQEPATTGEPIVCASYKDYFINNLVTCVDYFLKHFKADFLFDKPVTECTNLIIQQEISVRFALINIMYSPFSKEGTLYEIVLRRPIVFNISSVRVRALYILFKPIMGIIILGVCRIQNLLESCETLVHIHGIPPDIGNGFPTDKIVHWKTLRGFVCSNFNQLRLSIDSLQSIELLRMDLGPPTHLLPKVLEPVAKILCTISRQYTGYSAPWYLDILASRIHTALPLHYFSKELIVFLTREMHDRFITRDSSIVDLFRSDEIYYGYYENKLCSLFLFDFESIITSLEQWDESSSYENHLKLSKNYYSTSTIKINKRYIELLDAVLNAHISADSEHLIKVIDILYSDHKDVTSNYISVITEPLFSPLLAPMQQIEDNDESIISYCRAIRILSDIQSFVKNIGEHGFLDQKRLFYNRSGAICTMMRPGCLTDSDFQGLPRLFNAFQSLLHYITALLSLKPSSVTDWKFLYKTASFLIPINFNTEEFDTTLAFYRKMYNLESDVKITKISVVDCMNYHIIKLLQEFIQTDCNISKEIHGYWTPSHLLTEVIKTNDRLLIFHLLFKETVPREVMNKHPAILALSEIPSLIHTANDFSIIMRALFICCLCV